MLILALAIPLALIYGISSQEMEESIKVSGNFVSTSYAFQELNYEDSGKIRWLVSTGAMVESGQTLGLYKGETVLAEVTGSIEKISLAFENAYIQYTTMDSLELECCVEDKTLSVLEGGGLTTGEGAAVSLMYTYWNAAFMNI